MLIGRSCTRLLLIAVLMLAPALSQNAAPNFTVSRFPLPLPAPIRFPNLGFPSLTRAAGMIFSGTVTGIEHRVGHYRAGDYDGHPETENPDSIAITFHVENAILGVNPGEYLTIRQWTGVWSSGQRYRVGERLLLFLYPPSKLGLTSCVGGGLGRFDVDPRGRVWLSALHRSAFRKDPILGGKSQASFDDFALAVRRAAVEQDGEEK
jgi:hypothetical protein